MIPPLDGAGFIPSGRHPATLSEVESAFASSPHRSALWEEFTTCVELLQRTVPVCAVWLGGSFLTAKEAPGDVDAVFVLRADEVRALRGQERQVAALFASSAVKSTLGLRVDTFVLSWVPNVELDRSKWGLEVVDYQQMRGYWDDFWMRRRSTLGAHEVAAHPRRGYLEVTLDGYSR